MILKAKRLHPDAILPTYATDGAACFDLHSIDRHFIMPLGQEKFGTGLAVEVPPGWVMLVYSRSGHGFKHGVRLSNCVGVIDSDYRGEVRVALQNDGDRVMSVDRGDRIAQAMLIPAPQVQIVEADDLSETARGAGGFGSTGK